MKRVLLVVFLFGLYASAYSQVVSLNPLFPTAEDAVSLIFNAAEGNAGLAGFTGEIYAHTGVLTDKSTSPSDWRYVLSGWSSNTEKARLTALGNNLWELKITPSIRAFYGVPAGERILKMAFVFRNSNGSLTGRATDGSDIFVEVYEEGLNLTVLQPVDGFFLSDPGSAIPVEARASFADSILLKLDQDLLHRQAGNSLSYSLQSPETGIHQVDLVAYASGETVSKSFSFMVRGSGKEEELPAGLLQGANPVGDQSVTLVLYAPGKELVFAIGDFNDWQTDTDYLMNRTPDGSYFWIRLDSLDPDREYGYQYFVDGSIRIADPYTHKTSDPWNDQAIEEWVYPGLIDYPVGKTTQIVSVFQINEEEYQWDQAEFTAPDPEDLVIYELLIRDFMADHTFNGLIDSLDYLQGLGVNAIELMPVNEFEGNDSWGYNPSFYFAVDKYYGPQNSFKAFVDSAHQRGIAVIMDLVLNHSYGQSPLVRLYWDQENNRPAADNPWFNPVSPNPVFFWGSDFNHESLATQTFVDSVVSYWLSEFKVDGFRFDFTKGFTNTPGDGWAYDASRIAILKRMTDRIRAVNPRAYVILEHLSENREETELANYGMMLWGNMNGAYRIAVKAYLSGGASDLSGISYQERGWDQPSLIGYMESHDEERLMYLALNEGNNQNINHNIREQDIALKRMEISANFFIPVPGPKMIWMFGELGYDYSIDYNGRIGRKPIRWDYFQEPLRKRLYQVYGALGKLKNSHPVFRTTDYELVVRDTVKRIHLNNDDMNVTILGNFSSWNKLGQGGFQHTGWWYEYWTGDSLYVENTMAWMSFGPSEYRIYTDVRLNRPDIVSGLDHSWEEVGVNPVLYPNPVDNQLFLEIPRHWADCRVTVYSLDGRKIAEQLFRETDQGIVRFESRDWPKGIMLVRVQAGERVWAEKIIK